MANPRTWPLVSLGLAHVDGDISWVSGAASAAPTTYKGGGAIRGMTDVPAGIVKTATGTVTLNFKEAWIRLVKYDVQIFQATYNASTGACKARLSVNSISAAVPLLTFVFMNEAGATVDLAAGDTVFVDFTLKQRQ